MRYLQLIALAVVIAICVQSSNKTLACTNALVQDSQNAYVAKSFEWVSEHGAVIYLPAGLNKKAVFLGRFIAPYLSAFARSYIGLDDLARRKNGVTWTSRYASLVYTQAGSAFPIGGINEKGLVVESLTNKGAKPEDFATSIGNINELQWVAYQLDHYESVAEVIANAKALSLEFDAGAMHHMICDPQHECVVIEYTAKGKQLVEPLNDPDQKVITNSLVQESLKRALVDQGKPLPSLKGASRESGAESSIARYRIARAGLAKLNELAKTTTLTVDLITTHLLDPVWIEGFSRWNVIHEPHLFRTQFRTAAMRDRYSQIDGTKFAERRVCVQDESLGIYYVDMLAAPKSATTADITDQMRPLSEAGDKALIAEGIRNIIEPALIKKAYFSEQQAKEIGDAMLAHFHAQIRGPLGLTCSPDGDRD